MNVDPALPAPVQQKASSVTTVTRARFTNPTTSSTGHAGTGFRVHWARLKKKINSGSQDAPSESYVDDGTGTLDGSATWRRASDYPTPHPHCSNTYSHPPSWGNVGGTDGEPDELDEIVVDNQFEGYTDTAVDADGNESHTGRSTSERLALDPASSSHNPHTDKESTTTLSIWDRYIVLTILRWRILPSILRFHSLAFADPVAESQYAREAW